jgi:hypothetical protein
MKTIKLNTLKPNDRNPRKISDAALAKLCESIQRDPQFMELRPIVVDEDNVILGGNQRYAACRKLGKAEVPASWVKVAAGLTAEQRKRFVVVDNAPEGMAGEWDLDLLKIDWELPELGDLGFEKLLAELTADIPSDPVDAEPKIDKAAELNKKWKVKPGDLWLIGSCGCEYEAKPEPMHKLLCGDSTKAADVARVTNAKVVDSIVFDPEWDEEYEALSVPAGGLLAFTDGRRVGDCVRAFGAPAWLFVWDGITSWYTPNRPLQRGKLCLWFGDVTKYNFNGSHYGDAGEPREVSNTRGRYKFQPDPRGLHLSDVFQQSLVRLHADGSHSHEKPIDWVRMLIGDCLSGTVFDPFAGSGTTAMACQQLGRTSVSIEINPAFCAVILDRMKSAFPELEIKKEKR